MRLHYSIRTLTSRFAVQYLNRCTTWTQTRGQFHFVNSNLHFYNRYTHQLDFWQNADKRHSAKDFMLKMILVFPYSYEYCSDFQHRAVIDLQGLTFGFINGISEASGKLESLELKWHNHNGWNGSYFPWLGYLNWGRCTWSVIYCFNWWGLTLNKFRIYNRWHIQWRKPCQLLGWMKTSSYYSVTAMFRISNLPHCKTMSKKVPHSYPLGHQSGNLQTVWI